MSFPKVVLISSLLIFTAIGGVALFKKRDATPTNKALPAQIVSEEALAVSLPVPSLSQIPFDTLPEIDRIFQLFTTGPKKLPIVETVTYSSSVPWLKGRPAWIADYAAHFATSRHFIARSLNGKPDYFTQKVITGSQFNVFRKDRPLHFYLLVDLAHCKMGFYYVDLTTQERVLLKTYRVAVGRPDAQTPIGTYPLGNRIAVYQPGMIGKFYGQDREMVSVFGSRWIPFGEKGFGIHGMPWELDARTGEFVEKKELLGKQSSGGSLSLAKEDMEELFSIVITKPAYVVVVKDFKEAQLPGVEVATPTH